MHEGAPTGADNEVVALVAFFFNLFFFIIILFSCPLLFYFCPPGFRKCHPLAERVWKPKTKKEGNRKRQGMNLKANKQANKMVTKRQLDVLV